MTAVIDVLVGSDNGPRTHMAEQALEHSIRSRTQANVRVEFLRWDWGKRKNWTQFSLFRFCIPEYREFKGRVLYLDVDMIVLGDIAELYERKQTHSWMCTPVQANHAGKNAPRTEVSLIACNDFQKLDWYPSIHDFQTNNYGVTPMARLLMDRGMMSHKLPIEWNCLDGMFFSKDTKLVHFSNMGTQPWKPYPDRFPYTTPHRDPRMVKLWEREYEAAQDAARTPNTH